MVMRLHFERDIKLIVKPYDAGVILEDAHAPIIGTEPLADGSRCREDRLLEHVFKMPRPILVAVRDSTRECFMTAMLAPRLSDRLEFDIRRLATVIAKVLTDRLHLRELQVELTLAAELHQRSVIQITDWHRA